MEWFAVDGGSLEESRVVDASETRTADGTEVIYMVEKRADNEPLNKMLSGHSQLRRSPMAQHCRGGRRWASARPQNTS